MTKSFTTTSSTVFALLVIILAESLAYYVPVGQGGVAKPKDGFRTFEQVKTAVLELKQLCEALRLLITNTLYNNGGANSFGDSGEKETFERNLYTYEQVCMDRPKWKKLNKFMVD